MQAEQLHSPSALDSFGSFLASQRGAIDPQEFLINLLIASACAWLLGVLYRQTSTSLGDRICFSRNFLLLSTTTLLIISIVKSSLALSLGLVGALSIVRFRAAIKEPEELTFLFLAIAVGLGLGANQRIITVLGFAFICIFILLRSLTTRSNQAQSYHLVLGSTNKEAEPLHALSELLSEYCQSVKLKRYDSNAEHVEATYSVELTNYKKLEELQKALHEFDQKISITFLDLKGLVR